ncbi:PREDICTED: F-box protein At5g42460-like [Camelina sativa]|uniref:F-box protein At5g42460-like n=1 Tax=Camelina sativa TaxID=90675 RepID=A0ABM0XSJ1_CAMSA|nr:PREDICTED: F-box protein At5g42460-like [Camelina sativa]
MAIMMSELSRDLVEEVLIRVPLTSLRAVRLTCKKLNDVSKDRSFIKKHIVEAKKKQVMNEFEMIMVMDYKVYLMNVDLHSNVDPYITLKGTLFSLKDDANHHHHHQVDDIVGFFHCNGLLLCIIRNLNSRLVVWNPYFGETRWIQPRSRYDMLDSYALGYDEKKKYKILRFVDDSYVFREEERICEFELYSFESDSWKVVFDVPPEWKIEFNHRGLSVKGNTYWYATDRRGQDVAFLICFDFTTEKFGPCLPLPFNASPSCEDIVTLSSVGEEQFAVLFQDDDTLRMEIWVTSKVQPTEVSWNKLFLVVDMGPLTGFAFLLGTFFIDQKKNVAMVFDKDYASYSRGSAYIIGNNGYLEKVDFGKAADRSCYPFVSSYVLSTVQIRQLT